MAILIVPSVLAPDEGNWLINPMHPDLPESRSASRNLFGTIRASFKTGTDATRPTQPGGNNNELL
jgi:hypothetical protein